MVQLVYIQRHLVRHHLDLLLVLLSHQRHPMKMLPLPHSMEDIRLIFASGKHPLLLKDISTSSHRDLISRYRRTRVFPFEIQAINSCLEVWSRSGMSLMRLREDDYLQEA